MKIYNQAEIDKRNSDLIAYLISQEIIPEMDLPILSIEITMRANKSMYTLITYQEEATIANVHLNCTLSTEEIDKPRALQFKE